MRLLSQQAACTSPLESGVRKAIPSGCSVAKAVNSPAVLKVPGAHGFPVLGTTYENVRLSSASPMKSFDLTKELSTLRRDLESERSRSRAVAERLRSDLQAIDAEIQSSGSSALPVVVLEEEEEDDEEEAVQSARVERAELAASQFTEDEWHEVHLSGTALSSQDLPLMAAKLDSDASTTADALQAEASEQATAAATALARALHEGVRSLMEQGMEFRALAVRREASLKAALEASERARIEAEEQAVSSSSLACRSTSNPIREEEVNLAIAEQEICEALVGRLQAQVRTLEMQVECMDCELKAARSQAAEWELRHKSAMVTIQHMQQDPEKVVEPHEMSFQQRRALFQKSPAVEEPQQQQQQQQLRGEEMTRLSSEADNKVGVEGCGMEGLSPSVCLSPSSPLTAASIIGSRTPPLQARPLVGGSSQGQSPALQQPSWTVAGTRTALCAEVRASHSSPPKDAAALKKGLVDDEQHD